MEQTGEEEIKDEYYQVERITKHKIVRGKKYYLIKWVGYHDRDNTWEPVENLANVTYMIEEYENKRKLLGQNSDKSSGNPAFLTF
uniref:Putative chromobox protein protein n=1 Tax=Euplotes vannus TaxID=5939 RepID=Q6A1N8_EUPVA|nr:putative chromobox protein [Euplotes vannus]